MLALLVACSALEMAEPATAGPNRNAKILVHLTQWHGPKNAWMVPMAIPFCGSGNPYSTPTCGGIKTNGSLYPTLYTYSYLLVTDGDPVSGVAGLSCSINYNPAPGAGVDIYSWMLCQGLWYPTPGPYGDWPAPLSTIRIVPYSALDCQNYEPGGPGTGVVAPVGAFYLASYSPDTLAVIPSPATGVATVTSCAGVVDTVAGGGIRGSPSHLGLTVFSPGGTVPGYNPCGINTPAETTTWGRVKALFREGGR